MSDLQRTMADYGFESNDDYEYHLRCLMNNPYNGIKAINIEGHKGRRKTAFANALGRALEYPHLFYYDFTQKAEAEGKVIIPPSEDEHGLTEAPVGDFDHVMSEACAFSEGEQTVLILDQLQAADFKDHIRIYHFIKNTEWSYGNNVLKASMKNLLLILISDEPLYHSLQKSSFRIWVNAVSAAQKEYSPADFYLQDDVLPIMEALAQVFELLEVAPTHSEYKNILNDIHLNIHTEQQLIHSLYGWMEGTDRELLFSPKMSLLLTQVIDKIQQYHGMDEVIIES
ncbi:hypothetical protein [sulfur-oxidizing endosymbiont of Gigantopelta aegis]|uniref:hypothetical protein n=1 Tax=sulfur-oxidizing endosymbiont of Gigantopelta aegis TaxID=2794934 RepID=UPI0018DCEBEC|nr:hypothetical protein [sulfur-oxidizing endosymbiont of Gigantopelta aegis]